MKIQSLVHIFDNIFLISTSVLLALGSIGIFTEVFLFLNIINAVVALGYKIIQKGRVDIPKNYLLYTIFLLTLLVHTYFSHGKFMFFWIFLSGGLLWLEIYNFRNIFTRYFVPILVILGILMGILYFYSLKNPIVLPNLVSLFVGTTSLIKHSNIGDLWAVIIIPVFFLFIKKWSYLYCFLLIMVGVYFVSVSYSRAALMSLLVGIIYIFQKMNIQKGVRKTFFLFLLGIGVLFIYFGATKTLLLSRPYFLQALKGLAEYPFGTGVGNFSSISSASNLVHNIVLELVSGMGIFSIVFIFWLYKTVKALFISSNIDIGMAATFLAVLTDFCFNTTYTIPAFVWIWFISLGLIYQSKAISE